MLELARHFAEHRPFYRAMLTGSCAFATTTVRDVFGELSQSTQEDLAIFFASGATGLLGGWLINDPERLDPHHLADRLFRLAAVFAPYHEGRAR
jgi:hypothetical protein